jgi:hypothetical protein
MQFSQPPSWRPDRNQLEIEVYRGTVRDALGGLRNLEQLLGSLRVGPRALLSVLPDIQSCCAPLNEAILGLARSVSTKLVDAESVVNGLTAAASERLSTLSEALEAISRTSINAKARLRLEEQIAQSRTDIEAIFELIDLLGEAAWGRTMLLNLAEVAREAFRSSEPPGATKAAVRLTLSADIPAVEREASPRALVHILNLLVRVGVSAQPDLIPRLVFRQQEDGSVEVSLERATGGGEVRWTTGRQCRPETETCLRIAARAMNVTLDFGLDAALPRLVFTAP